jgi:hypothetical protein
MLKQADGVALSDAFCIDSTPVQNLTMRCEFGSENHGRTIFVEPQQHARRVYAVLAACSACSCTLMAACTTVRSMAQVLSHHCPLCLWTLLLPPVLCFAVNPGVIQTDNYYSAWRCRTITSPWDTPHNSSGSINDGSNGVLGGGQPACELILLHHDELKVPESLSRMAIKLGMWKVGQTAGSMQCCNML